MGGGLELIGRWGLQLIDGWGWFKKGMVQEISKEKSLPNTIQNPL